MHMFVELQLENGTYSINDDPKSGSVSLKLMDISICLTYNNFGYGRTSRSKLIKPQTFLLKINHVVIIVV